MAMRGRFLRSFGAAAALACLVALAGCGASAATHQVAIDGLKFQPDSLTVQSGDSIVWTNKDPFPHTVTSPSGGFDSHEIAPGQSWKYTASKKGTFGYTCTLHPIMKATLIVN